MGDRSRWTARSTRTGDNIIGKPLDDRICVFQMLEAYATLKADQGEVVAVATTQEEVGLRGATTAATISNPDRWWRSISRSAMDIPGAPSRISVTRLGRWSGDQDHGLVRHFEPQVRAHMRRLARDNDIPYQLEILPRGGTDAEPDSSARGGVPAITISIPTRYVHTVNEMCAGQLMSRPHRAAGAVPGARA